jgi:hypothetical protein
VTKVIETVFIRGNDAKRESNVKTKKKHTFPARSRHGIFNAITTLLCIVLIVLGPNLAAQTNGAQAGNSTNGSTSGANQASAANTASQPQDDQGIPPAPPLQHDQAGVPILFITSVLSFGGATTFWVIGSGHRSAYDAAVAAYEADASDANKAAQDSAGLLYLGNLGLGIGLAVAGIIFAIAGFATGNGSDKHQVMTPTYDPDGEQLIGLDGIKDGAEPSPSPSPSPAAK